MPELDYNLLIAYGLGLVLLYLLIRAFLIPLRVVFRVGYHLLIGGVALLAVNWAGAWVGFHLGLNPLSALVVGYLGVPGLLLLAAIRSLVA